MLTGRKRDKHKICVFSTCTNECKIVVCNKILTLTLSIVIFTSNIEEKNRL